MDWKVAAASGMAGGAIVEAIAVWGNLITWQRARYVARSSGRELPKLADYIDLAADALVALTRIILGGLAGLLLHTQIAGVVSAVAVGAAAPALLGQLGTVYTMRPANGAQATIEPKSGDLTAERAIE